MGNEVVHDFMGVLLAIVGVAVLTTLVLPGRQTPQVVQSVFSGFGGALSAAMGGSNANYGSAVIGATG